jgi:hypothetical protein
MRAVLSIALLTLTAGCATAGGPSSGDQANNPNLITRQEIQETRASNLYEVVNTLRPRWLQVIDSPSFSGGSAQILVYRDNVRLRGPEALRSLNPEMAQEIRWLDRMEAAARLSRSSGSGVIAGAIVVVTRGS